MNKNLLLTVGIWALYTLYKLHNVWFIRFVWETENIKNESKQTTTKHQNILSLLPRKGD